MLEQFIQQKCLVLRLHARKELGQQAVVHHFARGLLQRVQAVQRGIDLVPETVRHFQVISLGQRIQANDQPPQGGEQILQQICAQTAHNERRENGRELDGCPSGVGKNGRKPKSRRIGLRRLDFFR